LLSFLSRNNKLIFWALALWGVGEGLWWYLLPVYIKSLGADPVQIGFVLSVSMVVMTVIFIPSGWVTDRVSRRPLMIGGWVMGSAAILLLAAASSWQMAIPGLLLYNLSAFNMPALNAYVTAEVKSSQDLRRVFTTVFSGFTLGMMFSPAIGGGLADIVGLRTLFCLAAVFYAISTVIISQIKDQPVHSASAGSASSPLRGNRLFINLCILFFVIHLFAHLGVPLSPNYLQDVRNLPLGWIGILGSINGLGAVVLTLGLGRWAKGRVSGLLIGQATVGVYALLLLGTSAVPLLGLAFFLRGGLGAVRQLAAARLGEMMPASSMGLGFGVFQTVINLAFTISPYAAGWLYAFNPSYPFVANVVLIIPAMLLTLVIGRSGPPRGAAPTVEAESEQKVPGVS
jgi:DHA1 family tetracycline resistance protein-like MFS transporter